MMVIDDPQVEVLGCEGVDYLVRVLFPVRRQIGGKEHLSKRGVILRINPETLPEGPMESALAQKCIKVGP